ncbi:MAG: isochorismatase family protein [Bacteroidales bacterium]|nr:isochorismatase family protein [Bacteroidales bacterium]
MPVKGHYKEIIDNINKAIEWTVINDIHVVYIRHENLSDGTRTFKPNTRGAELVPEMKIVPKNIFTNCDNRKYNNRIWRNLKIRFKRKCLT